MQHNIGEIFNALSFFFFNHDAIIKSIFSLRFQIENIINQICVKVKERVTSNDELTNYIKQRTRHVNEPYSLRVKN